MNARPLAALAALAAAGLLLIGPAAQAATHTVSLSSNGPSPASITIPRGDTVTFSNGDSVTHTITHSAGSWSYTTSIPPGGHATTPAFTQAGTFGYDDSYAVALLVRHASGSITVMAPKPSPTRSPTASPRPGPTGSPTARPSSTPSASGTAAPTPAATGSGIAIGPGLGVQTVPPPPTTAGPRPNIAPPPSDLGTPSAQTIAYGGHAALVQPSPHRYGLPVLLALIGALGVLSLIARYLLSGGADARRW